MNELASVLAELEAPAPAISPLITLQPARAKAFVRLAIELVKLMLQFAHMVTRCHITSNTGKIGFMVLF